MGGPVQIGRARISFNSPQVPPCKECIERASSAKNISGNCSAYRIFFGVVEKNKGIGDAGSTAYLRMLWSAIVCLGLGLL